MEHLKVNSKQVTTIIPSHLGTGNMSTKLSCRSIYGTIKIEKKSNRFVIFISSLFTNL